MGLTTQDAAAELLRRRAARTNLHDYITYTMPRYKPSLFSHTVCQAVDGFIKQLVAGTRPILHLAAPPQSGKSEIVSRRLPAYLSGRWPDLFVRLATYSADLASDLSQDVRRNVASHEHTTLFPRAKLIDKHDRNTAQFFNFGGGRGNFLSVGVGGGLTGKPADIVIIDDPVKDQKEALSETTKEDRWNWFQSTVMSRMSERSGLIVMATCWAQDDLPGRIREVYQGNPRYTRLAFPAINAPGETGYNPWWPEGALVPELHSLEQMMEVRDSGACSAYWWAAMYQQSPMVNGGNIFLEKGVRHYLPKDLPDKFDQIVHSWDCTFKDTDGSDYVVGQVWGKRGADSYLLDQVRGRMSFTATRDAIKALSIKWPRYRAILIEDKANGPAVIDSLKTAVYGILPVEPDGSKQARAHAMTGIWEAGNLWLPDEKVCAWVRAMVGELLIFPAGAHDDQVDAMTQAIRYLYPVFGGLKISKAFVARTARGF